MNTIVLLVDRDSKWSPEKWVEDIGGKSAGNAQMVVEREGEGWLSIVRNDEVLDDFDELELSRLHEIVDEPVAYLVEWKGNALVELLLRSVMPGTRAAIDNDHGVIASVQQLAGESLESWVNASSLP